jgi:hypothetical protein
VTLPGVNFPHLHHHFLFFKMFVDSNGFMHQPNRFYVVDENGGRRRRRHHRKRKPHKAQHNHPTNLEIKLLENAVFNNKKFRIHFLQLLSLLHQADTSPWQDKKHSYKTLTLLHCWHSLKWRPSFNGSHIYKATPNPYRP